MPARSRARAESARTVAFGVIRAVDEADAYANLELARRLRGASLSVRDAALATELVSGTLRLRGGYDAIIDTHVSRQLDPPVRDALRLGSHQLLGMRIPAHAAVAATVELVKSQIGHRPAGLVNAVLRKVGQRSYDEWMDHLGASVATRFSHPQWIVDELAAALGEPAVEPLLAADNEPPRVTLVARPGLCEVSELVAAGVEPMPVSPYAATLAGGSPAALPAVAQGRAGVQDAGSQLVAIVLAEAPVVEARPAERWLDLCAGPGGKAALLQALAAPVGASVLASERAPHRAALVRAAGVRGVIAADGLRPAWRPGSFDRVLVDAPCSGLGALRRRPEARWRKRPEDLPGLVRLQRGLLEAAVDAVRPGGVVVYATCSPVCAETVGVVRGLMESRTGVRLLDAGALLPWVPDCDSTALPGAVQLWPHRHRTDAMFIAALRCGGTDAAAPDRSQ